MHRGVANIDHEISQLGQDLTKVNQDFPDVFSHLTKSNITVGVFGTLQSYPLPKNLTNYSFYVPDTFANSPECFPSQLDIFQKFNLAMMKHNGRNVSSNLALKDATRFFAKAKSLGITFNTLSNLTNQIISEQFNRDRLVRRRTSQIEIAFDLFYKNQVATNPDVSFFFTNHLASSMHRYWPSIFPNDYPEGIFEKDWCDRWKMEIPHAIKIANFQLSKLMHFCDLNKNELIVCSSMGQEAVQNETPWDSVVLISDLKKMLSYLKISESEWEPRLSMSPRIVIKPKSTSIFNKIKRLNKVAINGEKIKITKTSSGDIVFQLSLPNIKDLHIQDNGIKILPSQLGLENVNLQDGTGSNAYHIPEGILIHYKPALSSFKQTNNKWEKISVLDFAPSLIKSFNGSVPSYMKGEKGLFDNS